MVAFAVAYVVAIPCCGCGIIHQRGYLLPAAATPQLLQQPDPCSGKPVHIFVVLRLISNRSHSNIIRTSVSNERQSPSSADHQRTLIPLSSPSSPFSLSSSSFLHDTLQGYKLLNVMPHKKYLRSSRKRIASNWNLAKKLAIQTKELNADGSDPKAVKIVAVAPTVVAVKPVATVAVAMPTPLPCPKQPAAVVPAAKHSEAAAAAAAGGVAAPRAVGATPTRTGFVHQNHEVFPMDWALAFYGLFAAWIVSGSFLFYRWVRLSSVRI